MTMSSKTKRLDAVEIQLTPKEWAIRLVDESMKLKSYDGEGTIRVLTPILNQAGAAFGKQAEEKHPGNKPEDVRARYQLNQALRTEFHALKKLLAEVNLAIRDRAEKAGLEAALKISSLQTIILQDAFGRTARKAAGWIEVYETEGKDEEENRQIMLDELRAYMAVDFGEKATDSLPLLDMKIRFPSIIEKWVKDAKDLIRDVYRHQAAVDVVQDKCFDGHPILDANGRVSMARTVQAIEDAAGTFNDYLAVRADLFKADWEDEEENEGGYVTAIPGEREGTLRIDLEAVKAEAARGSKGLAKTWMTKARAEAVFEIRQQAGEEEDAFKDLVKTLGIVNS